MKKLVLLIVSLMFGVAHAYAQEVQKKSLKGLKRMSQPNILTISQCKKLSSMIN